MHPSATHLFSTPWEVNSSQPELSCRLVQCSHYDVGLLGAMRRLVLCPRLDSGSSLIAIKSCSDSPVTFPLSCNQSGRDLMHPRHRLSISLTCTPPHTHGAVETLHCSHVHASFVPSVLSFIISPLVLLLFKLSVSLWFFSFLEVHTCTHTLRSTDTLIHIYWQSVSKIPWGKCSNKMPLKSNKNW